MSGHTPGPWQVRHAEGLFAIASEGGWVATMDGEDENVDRANARLIAAAPDLYDALKAAESALAVAASYRDDHKALMQVTLDNARDVLAKARGTP